MSSGLCTCQRRTIAYRSFFDDRLGLTKMGHVQAPVVGGPVVTIGPFGVIEFCSFPGAISAGGRTGRLTAPVCRRKSALQLTKYNQWIPLLPSSFTDVLLSRTFANKRNKARPLY